MLIFINDSFKIDEFNGDEDSYGSGYDGYGDDYDDDYGDDYGENDSYEEYGNKKNNIAD